MRLSGISRIIEADNANRGLNNYRYHAKTEFSNYFIIHMELFIFYSFTNYSLELFSFILCTKTKKRLLPVLQTIICDVIITEYQELFADVTS